MKNLLLVACTAVMAVATTSATHAAARGLSAHDLAELKVFASLDTNHDGKLSRSEIPVSQPMLRSRFELADFNGDLRLDAREFVVYHEWHDHPSSYPHLAQAPFPGPAEGVLPSRP